MDVGSDVPGPAPSLERRHGPGTPSDWVRRWSDAIRPGGTVLDVACGHGRHLHWFARRGHAVTGVDRDAMAIAAARNLGEAVLADIEQGPWPLPGRSFDAVVVTNYLWRPLWADLRAAVAPDGLVIYETFASGNETVGRPARPEFLLRPGELLQAFEGLRIVAYEDGFLDAPERFVQRIVARRERPGSGPARIAL